MTSLDSTFGLEVRSDIYEFPVHHMRGGTSTRVVLREDLVPRDPELRDELLRHLMGVPLAGAVAGNRQITGLGRGAPTSNKVFLVRIEHAEGGPRLISTLAQLAADTSSIDWSVNCGNMSAALPLWAFDLGLIDTSAPIREVEIRNTNTGVLTTARLRFEANGSVASAEIPGMDGAWPGVDLLLHDPVGAKTGALLPTGRVVDEVLGRPVSCVDVAVPMVIASAVGFGKTGHEPVDALEADRPFMERLRDTWVTAGLLMGLKRRDGVPMATDELVRSETVPKVCIVGAPRAGGHIAVRYFTPQAGHRSMAVSGACCLTAATLLPGTVANEAAIGLRTPSVELETVEVGVENPAGVLTAAIEARRSGDAIEVRGAGYRRSGQILVRGHVPLHRASTGLRSTLEDAVLKRTGRDRNRTGR